MGIKRDNIMIDRVEKYLEFKLETYDKYIKDLDTKEKIESLFSKYPDEPIKALIELDSNEIIRIVSYFSDTEINEDDINTKKYWLEEATYNENLRDSMRYRDALNLFENIGYNLQEFYNKLFYIDKDALELKNLKNSTKELLKLLKTNKPIGDLSQYLPLFEINNFFVHDNVCDFLSLIAIYNVNSLKSKKNNNYIEIPNIEKENIKLLMGIVKNELESFFEKETVIVNSDKVKIIDEIMQSLLSDSKNILKYYPIEITEILQDIWEDNEIENELEKLSIPITVLRGKESGLKIDLNDEDQKILDEFVNKITKSLEYSKNKEEEKELDEVNKNNRYINKLKLLLNKLNKKDNIYFEERDFDLILYLLYSKNVSCEDIINVILTINSVNVELSNSNNKVLLEKNTEEKKEKTTKKKEVDLIKKYGYSFDNLPKKLTAMLNKELENKIDMLDLIEKTDSLKFIKEYCDLDTTEKINKKIYDVKSGQVFYLLMYSNCEIINKLLSLADEYNLDIKDIYSIPKVFGSIEIDGCYENFVFNLGYIAKNYPNLLPIIMKRTPYTLGINNQLLIRNIELSKLYKLDLETNRIGTKPSFRALGIKEYSYVIDRYIEINEYDYIDRFRYQLDTNYSIPLRIKYLQVKGIDNKLDGYVDINSKFDDEIINKANTDSIGNIELSKKSEYIDWLNSINEEKDKNMSDIHYVLKGIYISKPKVLITFGNLIKDNFDNIKEKLLYSIVKDSYLTEEEFNTIKGIIDSKGE